MNAAYQLVSRFVLECSLAPCVRNLIEINGTSLGSHLDSEQYLFGVSSKAIILSLVSPVTVYEA